MAIWVGRGGMLAQRAVAEKPTSPQILDTLGWAQFKSGDRAAARKTLQHSIQIQANDQNTYHLARVYQALGVSKQANQMASQSVALAKKSGDHATLQRARQLQAALTKH